MALNVLIACEESQVTTTEFRKLGCNAFSADIQEPSGGHPEWHIHGDVIPYLNGNCTFKTMDGIEHRIEGKWDLIIAHPPCTYLSNAGACRLYKIIDGKQYINAERLKMGMDGKRFFMMFIDADCDHIAVENPVPSRVFELPQKTQVIQPFEYGHPYTKKTYLWLKNLPALEPTNVVEPIGGYVCGNSEIWKKQAKNGSVCGKEKNPVHRSKTFHGIAKAFATQWYEYLKGLNTDGKHE